MGIFDPIHRWLAHRCIKDFDDTGSKEVRIRYGMFAGWFSLGVIAVLFIVRITLGVMTGSISVIANAFHLLSHLANSIILVVTFLVTGKPATTQNPFGHGRMEHIAPLIIAADLDVDEAVDEPHHERIKKELEQKVVDTMPGVAYCRFYITPRFAS